MNETLNHMKTKKLTTLIQECRDLHDKGDELIARCKKPSPFQKLTDRCDALTEIAQAYLDTLPFIPSDECCERIWKWAWDNVAKDEQGHVDWPEDGWDDTDPRSLPYEILDGGIPFSNVPRNGSLQYALGWSIVAQDANLRSLLEFVEGRQSEWIRFKCLADFGDDD